MKGELKFVDQILAVTIQIARYFHTLATNE